MRKKGTKASNTLRMDEVTRVAARLFAAKGYHDTSVDEIAKEIGVSKPAIYYYFPSKGHILRAIIDKMIEASDNVINMGQSNLPPREKLEQILREMIQFSTERKEMSLIGFEQANILPQKSRYTLRRRQKAIKRVVEQTLREGVEQGCFKIDNISMYTFALLAAVNWCYRWYSPEGILTPDEIADQYIKFIENGILIPDSK